MFHWSGSVTEYNKNVMNKSWKINEGLKKLIYNLLRSPATLKALKLVGDKHPWQHSAFTLENLEGDFYVPGTCLAPTIAPPKWKNIKAAGLIWEYCNQLLCFHCLLSLAFGIIMSLIGARLCRKRSWRLGLYVPWTSMTKKLAVNMPQWNKRRGVDRMFSKLTSCSSVHSCHCDTDSPPWQKSAQRDAAKMLELMEVCCLWENVKGSMALSVGNAKMQEINEMWDSGILVLSWPLCINKTKTGSRWCKSLK